MTTLEHIELLKSMGFYEEVRNKWVKDLPNVGDPKEFTDCAVVYLEDGVPDLCFIGGKSIKNDIDGMRDIDMLEELMMNDYCTEAEKAVCVPLFEEIITARMAIEAALGTIPTQVNGLKGSMFDLTDAQIENSKTRAYNMCVEMLKIYGIAESALKQYWGLDC